MTHKQAVAARVLSATASLNSRVSRRIAALNWHQVHTKACWGIATGDGAAVARRTGPRTAARRLPVVHDSRRGKRLLSCLGARSVEVSRPNLERTEQKLAALLTCRGCKRGAIAGADGALPKREF